jgi:hypothetical protein
MAQKDLKGKMAFQKVLEVLVDFLSGWKFWCERTELLRSLEIFWGFLVDFLSV